MNTAEKGANYVEVVIKEDPTLENDKIIIECRKLTEQYIKALEILKTQNTIIGYQNTTMHKIAVDDICYFELVDRKIFVYTASDVFESKQKFTEIEEAMDENFVRISRTVIINIQCIKALEPILNGRLEARLDNDEKIVISRQYVKALKVRFLNL